MTKKEIDAFIDNGITAKIHELLGVFSCDFFPFMEQHLMTNDDGEPYTDQMCLGMDKVRDLKNYLDRCLKQ